MLTGKVLIRVLSFVFIILVLTACGAKDDDIPDAVLQAQSLLAEQLEVPVEEVVVVSMEEVEWTDSCFGLGGPDEEAFKRKQEMFRNNKCVLAYAAPRGIGPTAWNTDERKRTQIRRRFMLLGQRVDGMRVWDVRRAIQMLRTLDSTSYVPLALEGKGRMAGIALYASLFEPDIARVDLWHLPDSHRDGPTFLNVLRYLDIPQAVAMAAERSQIRLYQEDDSGWRFPQAVAEKLGWPDDRFQMQGKSLK